MRRLLLALALVAPVVPAAHAGQLPVEARAQLQLFVAEGNRDDLLDATTTDLLSIYIVRRSVEAQRGRVELGQIRQDMQQGSLSARTGGSSVLARPSVTDLVSAALESGAIGRKSDDKSVSFSVNALPLRQLLSLNVPRGCGTEDADCLSGSGRWLRGLSGALSLNPSTASTPLSASDGTPDLSGFRIGGRTMQAASLRYELFVRERNSEVLKKALDDAAAALQTKASAFLKTEAPFEKALQAVIDAAQWKATTVRLLDERSGSLEDLEDVLLQQYEAVYELVRGNPDLQMMLASAAPEMLAYRRAQNALLAEKLYRKSATLDYVYERPADQPPLHQARLVVATPLGRKSGATGPTAVAARAAPTGMLTLNGGVSIFDPGTGDVGERRIRDAQFSVGVDWSPRTRTTFRPTYTAAYYFQYMVANGVLKLTGDAVTPGGAAIVLPKAAKEVLNTKGAIHIVQVRASFPVGQGVSFPAAVSYSNRSELITGRAFWQGHFGVSYDFGQLRKALANR